MKRIIFLALLLAILPPGTYAQMQVPSQMSDMILAYAKDLIWSGKALGPDNKPMISPPAGKDKSIAYIPDDQAKEIMGFGMVSGTAEACGLEWNPHFQSMMKFQRQAGRNEYQMSYIGILHGSAQSLSRDSLKEKCDATMRTGVERMIAQNIAKFTGKSHD